MSFCGLAEKRDEGYQGKAQGRDSNQGEWADKISDTENVWKKGKESFASSKEKNGLKAAYVR